MELEIKPDEPLSDEVKEYMKEQRAKVNYSLEFFEFEEGNPEVRIRLSRPATTDEDIWYRLDIETSFKLRRAKESMDKLAKKTHSRRLK